MPRGSSYAPHALSLVVVLLLAAMARPAAAAPAFGAPVDGLALGLEISTAGGVTAELTITNTSDHPITLWSHVATHETHFDWFAIDVSWRDARLERDHGRVLRGRHRHPLRQVCTDRHTVTLGFIDSRDKSVPMAVTLAPGARLHHTVDLAQWAGRSINRGFTFRPGAYRLTARYRATDRDHWRGALASAAVDVRVPGTRDATICDAP